MLAAAKSLVQQRSEIWRRGAMLVQLLGESVMVSNGIPEVPRALAGMCSGAAAKAEPLVGMPGQLIALEVRKLPGDSQPCRVLCRSRGSSWAIQVRPLAARPALFEPASCFHHSLQQLHLCTASACWSPVQVLACQTARGDVSASCIDHVSCQQ